MALPAELAMSPARLAQPSARPPRSPVAAETAFPPAARAELPISAAEPNRPPRTPPAPEMREDALSPSRVLANPEAEFRIPPAKSETCPTSPLFPSDPFTMFPMELRSPFAAFDA